MENRNILQDDCIMCFKCVAACPVEAMSLVSANDPAKPKKKASRLDESTCLGCGVCSRFCPEEAISLQEGLRRVFIMPPQLRSA